MLRFGKVDVMCKASDHRRKKKRFNLGSHVICMSEQPGKHRQALQYRDDSLLGRASWTNTGWTSPTWQHERRKQYNGSPLYLSSLHAQRIHIIYWLRHPRLGHSQISTLQSLANGAHA